MKWRVPASIGRLKMKALLPAFSRRLSLFTALVSAVLPAHSHAQSAWNGSADNEFSNTSNWTPSAPGTSDTATVNTGSPQVTNDATIGQLNVGGGNVTVTNTGALTVTNGSTINSGSVSINSGGVLNSDVNLNGGSLSVDGDLNGGLMLNTGNVTVNGTLRSGVVGTGTSLSNNGRVNRVDVSSGGTFVNNSGATAGAITNAGTASNAGTVGSLTNTAGNFTNSSGGTITGKTVVAGGTVTNNFVVTEADVSTAGTFVNNSGATIGTVNNAGTTSNAGTVGSLTNTAGSFTNNAGGTVTGKTVVLGGTVTNNFVMTEADVSAGAAFVNNSSATAGAITNAGNATNAGTVASLQNNAGTFTNNAGGVVTGSTVVNGGNVVNNASLNGVNIGVGGMFTNASGANAGAVTNGGSASNAGTLASLTNTGGTFTNNAGGTITGKTVITGGTVTNNFVVTEADVSVAAAFVNNTGATAGAITNSGTVTNAGTVASLQNNAGTFTNNTGGTVTGTTAVSGGTVVNNATLANVDVGNAGSFTNNSGAVTGTVTNAGTASNDGTVAALVNSGGVFSNTGTISGAATVSGGSLVNDGTIAGTVDIYGGGLLSGSGVVGGLFVNAGGILAPGPGIATLAVNGDLTFRAGSTYQLEIDASGFADRVNVSGAVDIQGGTLTVRGAYGEYDLATNYTILSAASITGSFENVTSNFAFLSPELTYGATDIDLQLDRNDVAFADVAETANGRASAAAVEALGASSPLYLAVLPLDADTASSAFSQLDGEVHASLQSAFLWESSFAREATLDQLVFGRDRQTDEATFWTSGYLSWNVWSSDGNAAGIDDQTAGILFGADGPISDQWRLGGLLGYSQGSFQQANTDSYYVGLYAAGDIGAMNLVGGAIYARNDASTRREVAFETFADQLTADYASATSQVFADLSWKGEMGGIKLQPFANLAYINLDTDSFRESGSDAALSVEGDSQAIATSTIGLRWSMDEPIEGLPTVLTGMVGWRHIAGDVTPSSRFAFAGGTPFLIEGITMPQDALVAKVGISAKLSKSARLTLNYAGEFGNGLMSSAVQANLSASF
jgi:subtilase-type serine protease